MEKNKAQKEYPGRAVILNMVACEALRNKDIVCKPEGKEGASHKDIWRETIPRKARANTLNQECRWCFLH